MSKKSVNGSVRVNGAELYYEVRGGGPSVLLIHGTGLDAGCYEEVADALAKDFTVVTYDRRGYSRSPRPAAWTQTSIGEQADDAAGLIEALNLEPVAVFGSSSAALITLDLVIRVPEKLRGAVLHEPSVFTFLPLTFVEEQFAGVTPMIEAAVATEGTSGGLKALQTALVGSAGYESLGDKERRERWLTNADLVFGLEFPNMVLSYHPDAESFTNPKAPVQVLRAAESLTINSSASEWLADHTKTKLVEIPGAHLAYCVGPKDFEAGIRPFLSTVS